MPVPSQPEDIPAAVRFHVAENDGAFEVTVSPVTSETQLPFRIDGGAPRFAGRDAFKASVVEAGMSPAVAEDQTRSFNATARQLRQLGFSIQIRNSEAAA